MVLSITTFIRTITNDVSASTAGTGIRDGFLYHRKHYHLPSLTFQPPPFDIINGHNPIERESALNILDKLPARRDISRGFYEKLQTLNTQSNRKGLFGFLRGRRK